MNTKLNNKYLKQDLSFGNIDALLTKEEVEDRNPLLPSEKNCRMCIIGSSGSGKTSYTVQLITQHFKVKSLYLCCKHLDQPKLVYLIDFYRQIEKDLSKKMKKPVSIIKMITNDLSEFPTVDEVSGTNNIIVFDDMLLEPDKDNKIGNYWVRGRHHNCSCFFLSQSFFGINRKIRLNTNLWSIFDMLSLSEIGRIHRECASDLTKQEFISAFKQATRERYNFLYIDNNQSSRLLKYRQNLDNLIEF